MARGRAKTEEVESVTGSKLGNNKLLEASSALSPSGEVKMGDKAFVMPSKMQKPPPPDQVGNVILPPGANPEVPRDEVDDTTMYDLWLEHQEKRRKYINKGYNSADADAAGLKSYTLDEFKANYSKLHPKTPEQIERE